VLVGGDACSRNQPGVPLATSVYRPRERTWRGVVNESPAAEAEAELELELVVGSGARPSKMSSISRLATSSASRITMPLSVGVLVKPANASSVAPV